MQICCACMEPGGPQAEWDGEDGEIDKDLCMWNFRVMMGSCEYCSI